MSVLIKGLNLKPRKDGFDGKGLVIIGYDDKLYAVAHEQIIPLPDHGDLIEKDALIDVLYHGRKNISEIQRGVKDEKTISYCQGIMVGYANSRMALNGAPVVIPAERSEDANNKDSL